MYFTCCAVKPSPQVKLLLRADVQDAVGLRGGRRPQELGRARRLSRCLQEKERGMVYVEVWCERSPDPDSWKLRVQEHDERNAHVLVEGASVQKQLPPGPPRGIVRRG